VTPFAVPNQRLYAVSMVKIRLLGGLETELDGRGLALPPGKPSSLFAWLALNRGMHARVELASRFWPDVLEASSRASLRSALWTLRSALGDAAGEVHTTREQVGLADGVWTDAEEFRGLMGAGRHEEAIALCGGRLLAGLDDDWVFEARDQHDRQVGELLAELARRSERDGDAGAALEWTRRRAALDPLSEEVCRELMERLAAVGDRAAALAAYGRLRDRFRRELGISPSEETRLLAGRLAHESAAGPRPASLPAGAPDRPGAPPLTGRDQELAELSGAWQEAKAGRGGLAVVTGEGGIGKTRLVTELEGTARGEGGAAATCAALDLGAGAPFGLWAELLRDLARDSEMPPEGTAWAADLARLSPDIEARLGPARATATASPELERARLFEAMVAMLEWATRERPCLLLMEDVHLADGASLELLAYVARRLSGLAALLVLTRRELPRRPEVDTLVHKLPGRGVHVRTLELAPLADDDIRRLARAVAELDEDGLARVVAAAEGNPLLAVEAARAVAGRGELAEGLRGAVRAAAATLDGDAKLVAELAAVAGRDIERAEAAHLPVGALSEAAGLAIDTGLMVSHGGRLGYRHALLRDALYADLSEPRRAWLHEAFASALTAEGSPRRAAEASHHLLLAGRDRAAVEQLARAAEDARSVAAYAEAAGFLEEAIRLMPDDADLLQELAEVEAWRGRRDAAMTAFDRACVPLERSDRGVQALAWIRRGRWLRGALCYPTESRAAYLKGLELLDAGDHLPPDARTEAVAGLAWAEAVAGDAGRAEELLAQLEDLDPSNRRVELDREVARGHLLIRRGHFAESYEPLSAAAGAARQIGRPDMAYSCLINAASAAACAADFERSLEFADRCRTMMREAALAPLEANALAARAHILTRLGRLDEAGSSASEEAALAERLDDPALAAMADHDCGTVRHATGDHDQAERLLAKALDHDAPVNRPLARLTRAESLVALGRLDEAEEELRSTALEPLAQSDFPDTLVARLSRIQALIAHARGEAPEARRRLEEAARTWRRRAGAYRLGDSYMAVMVDLGRPPVLGLVEPRRELERVEAELAAIPETVPGG
jgi:DNA-binding SARP family transcriptional activator/tetratricopeptide (TPR) repeat protein